MKLEATVSSKGQITVPIEIRKRLNLKSGDRLRFLVEKGDVKLLPAREEENPFTKWIGALNPKGTPAGTAVKWVRSLRDAEDEE